MITRGPFAQGERACETVIPGPAGASREALTAILGSSFGPAEETLHAGQMESLRHDSAHGAGNPCAGCNRVKHATEQITT